MRKVFKSTVIDKATLLGESVTNRYALAKCTARLEWHKVMDDVPALGKSESQNAIMLLWLLLMSIMT